MARNNKDELIRQAAIRVFAREGFHRARMETIAHEAGVAVGTIYNYFESKRDVLLAVFEAEFEKQMSFFERLQESGLSIPEQIAQILQGHFSLLRERAELAQVLLQERFNPGEGFKEKLSNFHYKVVERIEALIREGIDQGWIRSCDPRIIAPALFAVVQSIGSWEIVHSETVVEELFQTAPTELADFIWKGLRKGDEK